MLATPIALLAAVFVILVILLTKKFMKLGVIATSLLIIAALAAPIRTTGTLPLTELWFIFSIAALAPLLVSLVMPEQSRSALGTSMALLWPSGALFIWQSPAASQPARLDIYTAIFFMTALTVCAVAFSQTMSRLLESGEGKLWLGCALFLLLFVSLAPWGGSLDGCPLVVSQTEDVFQGPAHVHTVWQSPLTGTIHEAFTVATVNSEILGAIRVVLKISAALATLMLFAFMITGSIWSRNFLTITAVIAAVVALLLPIISLFPSMESYEGVQVIQASLADRLNIDPVNGALRLVESLDEKHYHLVFAVSPGAALLPGLAIAIFAGLGQTRQEEKPTEHKGNIAFWGAITSLVLGMACVWGYIVSEQFASGYALNTMPWTTTFAGFIAVSGAGIAAQTGGPANRLIPFGIWLAWVCLVIGLLGPGEGWASIQ